MENLIFLKLDLSGSIGILFTVVDTVNYIEEEETMLSNKKI